MIALCFPRKFILITISKSLIAIKLGRSVTPFIGTCCRKNSDIRISPEGKAIVINLEIVSLPERFFSLSNEFALSLNVETNYTLSTQKTKFHTSCSTDYMIEKKPIFYLIKKGTYM